MTSTHTYVEEVGQSGMQHTISNLNSCSTWWPLTICTDILLAAKNKELEVLAGEMKSLKQVQLAKDKAIAVVSCYPLSDDL